MDLSVVIVSYNTCELLRSCLASVYAETTDIDYEVLVIDNNSADGSATMVQTEFPMARVLALPDNVGFARGCNLGVAASSGEYILLLNPDTVVHDHALEHLLAFGRGRPVGGIYGGRTIQPDGEVDPRSAWGQPSLWSLVSYAAGLTTIFRRSRIFDPESIGDWQRDSVREVGFISGSVLLAERSTWDRLGGFDERFWMYGEDADLSFRARAAGYRPVMTPSATVTHVVGASSSSAWKRRLLFRGKITFIDKNWSPSSARVGKLLLLTGVATRAAVTRLARRPSPWREVWDARAEWMGGWPEVVQGEEQTLPVSPLDDQGDT